MSLALLLATELDEDIRAGHTVLGISAPGPYVEQVEALGVTHVPVVGFTRSWNPAEDLKAFLELIRTLRRLKLDVLHTHTPKAGVMGRIAGRLVGVPVVVNTCHGLWVKPEDPVGRRAFVYGLEALAVRFSDYELFQNAEDAHTLRRFLKRGRWQVVGNGIDLERFQPDPNGRARVRAEWGVDDDTLVVGTIGRRVREKGLAEFAEAAHALRGRAVFVWVGPEDDTDADVGVPHLDAVRFVGECSDMPAVYSALDVFALPSYREGFSRASMEAAACGLPMVLSDIRGCREIGTDSEHLLLVEPRSGDALVAGLERLIGDADLRQRLGAAARERAGAEFDQRRVARASLAAYGQVLARKAPRARDQGSAVTVLHVLPNDQGRGAQVYAGQMRDALAADPQQRHLVVTLFDSPTAAARADIEIGTPSGVLRRAGLDPRALAGLRSAIRRERADLVVAHGGEALKYVVPASGRVPTVYYKVGLSSAEISRPWHRRLYRLLSNRVDKVVGVSQAVAEQVASLFGVPPDRLAVIPNGRDPQLYRPLAPSEPHAEPERILFVGALEPGKRPELFLDVVEILRARGLAFSAAMAGDGPLRERLAPRAEALGVDLLGVRSDVPELLRTSAVLLMTSRPDTEGMPGVVIEAGLSGVPVVSTPAAGVGDVIVNGQTGWITDDSERDLADRVALVLGDAAERTRMASAARQNCLAGFSLGATAGRWRRLAGELVGGSAAKADLAGGEGAA